VPALEVFINPEHCNQAATLHEVYHQDQQVTEVFPVLFLDYEHVNNVHHRDQSLQETHNSKEPPLVGGNLRECEACQVGHHNDKEDRASALVVHQWHHKRTTDEHSEIDYNQEHVILTLQDLELFHYA